MSILKSLFATKESARSGPETAPVKMNLEERMAFRREMLYEAIKVTMQANGVLVTKADAKFVAEVKSKTAALEDKWVKDAEAKGLKNAGKVLAEFRAEIAKQEK